MANLEKDCSEKETTEKDKSDKKHSKTGQDLKNNSSEQMTVLEKDNSEQVQF